MVRSFHLFVSPLISFIRVMFSVYRLFTFLVKYFPKEFIYLFIFDDTGNGIVLKTFL